MKKLLSVFAIMAMASGAIGAAADVDGRPYEIVWANRTHDDHEPILPMTDAAGWRVETQNAVARLESATDRKRRRTPSRGLKARQIGNCSAPAWCVSSIAGRARIRA